MSTVQDPDENIILEIYKSRYQQVQHFQQMRATYFNIYIAVVGFSVSAIFGFGNNGLDSPPTSALLYLSILIWFMSIFSMMRAERWGGHISHDINTMRRIQNFFAGRYKSVEAIIPINDKPLVSVEFDRPLWNRNRSIETPIFITGAIMSAFIIAYSVLASVEIKMLVGIVMIALPILIWRAEVSNLLRRHARCCMAPPSKP